MSVSRKPCNFTIMSISQELMSLTWQYICLWKHWQNKHEKHWYRKCIFCTHSQNVKLQSVDIQIQIKVRMKSISWCLNIHDVMFWGLNHSKFNTHFVHVYEGWRDYLKKRLLTLIEPCVTTDMKQKRSRLVTLFTNTNNS